MNTLIKKECRSLRTSFAVAIGLPLLCALVFIGNEGPSFIVLAYATGAGLMAASVFGNEFQARTLLLLLTQPTPRHRLWRDKMKVLGLGLAIGFLALFLSFVWMTHGKGPLENGPRFTFMLGFIPLVAFCSTPFFTLRSKNTLGGVIFTGIIPFVLVMIFTSTDALLMMLLRPGQFKSFAEQFGELHPAGWQAFLVSAALVYCAVFYWAGRRAFMNFEVVEAQAQEVAFPKAVEKTLGCVLNKIIPGYTGPFASLVRKELQLHRVSYFLAALTVVAVPLLNLFHGGPHSELIRSLMIVLLWFSFLVTTLLVGLVTVAEERHFGLLDWQRMLPASARKQWAAKMLVALFTSVLLGVLLPGGLLPLCHNAIQFKMPQMDVSIWRNALACLLVFGLPFLSVFGLVVFASSISPNMPRALAAAIGLFVGCALLGSLMKISGSMMFDDVPGWHITTEGVIECSIVVLGGWLVLLNWLSFSNFKTGHIPARRIWWQVVALLLYAGGMGFLFGVSTERAKQETDNQIIYHHFKHSGEKRPVYPGSYISPLSGPQR